METQGAGAVIKVGVKLPCVSRLALIKKMNRSLRILLIVALSIGFFVALRLYLGRDRDPMYYYDGLKNIKIGVFHNWRIYTRKARKDDYYNFTYNYLKISQNNQLTDTSEERICFDVEKTNRYESLKIGNPRKDSTKVLMSRLSRAQLYDSFAILWNIDTNRVKDTLFTLIKECFSSNANSIWGASPYNHWTSFDFGKDGDICLLYTPNNIESLKKTFTDGTIINKNWLYFIRKKKN